MTRNLLSICLLTAAAGACSEVPENISNAGARVVVQADGQHVLSIDPELHRQREESRARSARPRATPRERVAELGAHEGAVLVVRTASATSEIRDVTVDGEVEGQMFVVADVDVERVVRGAAPAASRLTVEMRVSSALAGLVTGERNLIALDPADGQMRPGLAASYRIVGAELPEIGSSLGDALRAIEEVSHAN